MSTLTVPIATLAGVVSFASPCFLPIVPTFVGYIVGGRPGTVTTITRREAIAQSLVFVAGFTVVFVGLWASIGLVGYVIGDHRDLLRIIGGAVMMVLGLHLVGLLRIGFLDRTMQPRMDHDTSQPPSYRRSALLGLAFGAGWTPCIGPVLGGVLGLATVSGTVGEGVVLLLAYSAGIAIPFVLVALGAKEVATRLRWFAKHYRAVQVVAGSVLIITGFLMVTNLFARLAGMLPPGWL